ncbi:MAG: trigger factor family protein, partial [Muribaculaceae bacterium]|nr:trigger factor family protein [Muribaculaceae bacterium]
MNITFEKIDDVNGKIIAQVEEADYAKKVDAELRKIGNTHNIPGFRKGHISLPQLRQRFGKQVKSDVLNRSVYEAVADYIKEQKLSIIGQPIAAEVKEINLADKDYTFEYEVGMAPAIDLKLDKEVHLPYKAIQVTDQMVADEDKSLRERFGAQVPGEEVDEKALVKGSIMQLKEDGSINDAEDAIQVINGIVAPMYFKSKDEAAKFIGKKVNDKVAFNPYNSCEGNVAELAS